MLIDLIADFAKRSGQAMESTPQILSYSRNEPWHKRRRVRRAIIWISILSVVSAIGWTQRDWFTRHTELVYLQWKCNHYNAPKDQIIYLFERDELVWKLVSSSNGYRARREFLRESLSADRTIDAWNRLDLLEIPKKSESGGGVFGGLIPQVPPRSQRIIDQLPERSGPAVLFLHHRASVQTGKSRLVVVTLRLSSMYDESVYLTATTAETKLLGGLASLVTSEGPAIVRLRGSGYNTIEDAFRDRSVCFYAGQVDPTSDARFTIAYEVNGEEGIIDGTLQDDGTVLLIARTGPATRPEIRTPIPRFVTPPDIPTLDPP